MYSAYHDFLAHNPYPRDLSTTDTSLLNFSHSDYLGLSQHPEMIARSMHYVERYGTSVSASRLVSGNIACYDEIESLLACHLGKESALIFPTGFQANISILSALLDEKILGAKPLVFADHDVHASLIAGFQHHSTFHRFKHNDLDHLTFFLKKSSCTNVTKIIVVESIYSMEGDVADLEGLITLAKTHGAMLYVDDAHAVGMYGKNGFGKACDYADDIDFLMGTFSKGLGGFGAYLGCAKVIRQYLINKCRGFIYSTGLPPSVLGSMQAALELVPTMKKEREHLQKLAESLRAFFRELDMSYGKSTTHIVPWIIGDANEALAKAEQLKQAGILAYPMRPPSVPHNLSRLRFCLSVSHTLQDLEKLKGCLASLVSSTHHA